MGSARDTFLAVLNTGAFLLCVSFLAYVLLIIIPFVRRRPAEKGSVDDYRWHFVIPCLNEAAVIERTIRRLLRDQPAAHVWCVDDASTDETPQILARLGRSHPQVHVITRRLPNARRGKGPAL